MQTIEDIINIGFTNHQGGRLEEAERAYREVLNLDCDNAEVCNLMGVLKLQQNDVDSAIDWVEKAINRNPCEYFYETLFQTYIRGKMYEKIVECEKSIIQNYPKNFSLMFNIALAYKNLKQNKRAIEFYDKALKIDPTSYQAWYNLAHIYNVENQAKKAISALKICKKLRPKDRETEYFLSIALMRGKDYGKGLKLFESRLCKETAVTLQNKSYPNLASFDKLWKGENIKNKTIFVYYEAGFGDVIMFARYLPLLKKKCKKIIFYPQKPLVPLFENNNLGVDEIIEGYIPEQNMSFDVHTPLLSLPYLLGLKGSSVFESSEGYMYADTDLVKKYKDKFFSNEDLKIGIKWQGNTYYDTDRVIPTEAFEPLIELKGTKFYSFQTFEGSEELEKLSSKYDVTDIGSELLDFNQTAAALMNLDLVICNDTSLAHLAGALGIPCFVLLPYEVNWRWHEDLSKCDWYDSIKLFRQKSIGSWSEVFEEVKELLTKTINKA
ncbi:MAG: tetratricopeptide repeat protein [Cyanobacteria bacterium SIG31]|nr:tetratricopeptide repeat protein [Cyanobacteria bacterium SIG31]